MACACGGLDRYDYNPFSLLPYHSSTLIILRLMLISPLLHKYSGWIIITCALLPSNFLSFPPFYSPSLLPPPSLPSLSFSPLPVHPHLPKALIFSHSTSHTLTPASPGCMRSVQCSVLRTPTLIVTCASSLVWISRWLSSNITTRQWG